jgi:hypothetical protein
MSVVSNAATGAPSKPTVSKTMITQTQLSTSFFDAKMEAANTRIAELLPLHAAGVRFHEKYCNERVQSIKHAISKANAELHRIAQAKELYLKGVPFGVAISAANRNATQIVELNPREAMINGEIVTMNTEKKGFFVCVDGKIEEASEYIVVLSTEYHLIKLTGSL